MSRSCILAVDKVGSRLIWFAPGGTTLRTMSMPCAPHDMVMSASGDVGYISIYGSGNYACNDNPGDELQVVNLLTGACEPPLSVSPYSSPHGLAIDEDGLLWVTCDSHGVLLAISVERREIVAAVSTGSTGTHWVIASRDGSRLYTSNKQDPFLSVVNARERRVERQIDVPHGTEGICLSPDGRWLYAADHRRAVVLKIDTKLDAVVDAIALEGFVVDAPRVSHHMRVRVSPDGRLLCIAVYHYDVLVLVETAVPSRQRVILTGAGPMAMVFHPEDAKVLYLSNHDEGSVSVVDVEAASILKTFPCGAGIESMEFVPAY